MSEGVCRSYGVTPKKTWPMNKHTGFDKIQMNIGELSNGLSHWVKHQWLVFHTWRCRCEGVGRDSGCGHEESYLMHNTEHSL